MCEFDVSCDTSLNHTLLVRSSRHSSYETRQDDGIERQEMQNDPQHCTHLLVRVVWSSVLKQVSTAR